MWYVGAAVAACSVGLLMIKQWRCHRRNQTENENGRKVHEQLLRVRCEKNSNFDLTQLSQTLCWDFAKFLDIESAIAFWNVNVAIHGMMLQGRPNELTQTDLCLTLKQNLEWRAEINGRNVLHHLYVSPGKYHNTFHFRFL